MAKVVSEMLTELTQVALVGVERLYGQAPLGLEVLQPQAHGLGQALEGLERVGFRLEYGEDGVGWPLKYRTRGGGYYFNIGCSELIISGEIDLIQYHDIDRFVSDGVVPQSPFSAFPLGKSTSTPNCNCFLTSSTSRILAAEWIGAK